MAAVVDNPISSKKKISGSYTLNGNNEIILYSYHHCFYTQKVLMVLYEKNIPFTIKKVNITKEEQYQLWYLKINPKGEVPVLKDGIKCIPDTERIIEYLEDNFSNGEHSRLIPLNQGPEIKQKIIRFNTEINSIPANVITLGSLFNDEYCSSLKYPFVIPSVRKMLKASEKSKNKTVRRYAAKYPEYQEILLQKAALQEKMHSLITDKIEFQKVLDQVAKILDQVEKELSHHNKNECDWWLFGDCFTIADVALSVLLDRLSRVGLENYFWGKGRRPNVKKYYIRVQQRESYKKTMPTLITDLSVILKDNAPLILGVSLLTVLTVLVRGFLYFKK